MKITVYEIRDNGFFGASKEIDASEGIDPGWTYTAPPEGKTVRWENGYWIEAAPPIGSYSVGSGVNPSDVREERNTRLAACDWTQLPDAPVDREAWAAYRQALRDITDQPDFPDNVEWPIPPA